tara:strand:- start:212 stop:1048 length:837 start_codon:yes stop_codon:yes gene_type:complete
MIHSGAQKVSDKKTSLRNQDKLLSDTLLTQDDPKPVDVLNIDRLGETNILIICDHASNKVPRKLNQLGVDDTVLNQHIGSDIGTDKLGPYIANALNAPAVISGFSRLVIDLNRDTDSKNSIPEVSDHIKVPGNQNLSKDQKQKRLEELYRPYHQKIDDCIDIIKGKGKKPFVISIHSFTPEMDGKKRETDIGILWNENKDISLRLIGALRNLAPAAKIDGNAPYSLLDAPHLNHTINKHNLNQSDANILVEFKQDLISDDAGVKKYGDLFVNALQDIL